MVGSADEIRTAVVEATGVTISNIGSFLLSLCRRIVPPLCWESAEIRPIVDMMGYGAKGAGKICQLVGGDMFDDDARWLTEICGRGGTGRGEGRHGLD